MNTRLLFVLLITFVILNSCANEKIGLPTVPDRGLGNTGAEVYVQLTPVWDNEFGMNLNTPSDILLGWDNFLYIADTGNDRIIMSDISGEVQSVLNGIKHPLAITQDNLLNLFIVNGSNRIFKIDLVSVNHVIADAPIDTVHIYSQRNSLVYRGISSYFFENKHKIYAAAVDNVDPDFGDIIDFEFFKDNPVQNQLIRRGPLPLFHEGQGLYVVKQPLCVKSQSEGRLDFVFGQLGENNFLVQGVTAVGSGQEFSIGANTTYIGTDFYADNKYIYPADIDVDQNGFIFVVDAQSTEFNVYRFSNLGKQLQAFGGSEQYGQGARFMSLKNPKGIAVTFGGEDPTVYISDTGNNRILRFRLNTLLN